MNIPNMDNSLPTKDSTAAPLPWSLADTWIGLGLLAMIQVIILTAVLIFRPQNVFGTFTTVLLEFVYILPAVNILAWRGANWKLLGFNKFDLSSIELGCGLVVASFFITTINNIVFKLFKQNVQADVLGRLFESLHSPYWLVFTAVIVAPLVEESFFRGFLFAGFRQSYGWNRAALLSSFIFATGHLEPAALLPTFVLGYIFCYLYQKSNSILPGMLMHFLVNAFGIITVLVMTRAGQLIPR